MTPYSSQQTIDQFLIRITERYGRSACPAFVNDLDGNLLIGYSLAPGQYLPLGSGDDPKKQSIPFDSSLEQIQDWVQQGVLIESVFAEKPMDARLPKELVKIINSRVSTGAIFDIAFLTSRNATDAVTILRESGVEGVDSFYMEEDKDFDAEERKSITLVADSGATLFLGGNKRILRSLNDEEQAFLTRIDRQMSALNAQVRSIVTALGFNDANCPDLRIEVKGIAKNVHYRQVLTTYGQIEGSELDRRIGAAVAATLHSLIEDGPRDSDGSTTFKMLDGPATIEVKVANINKGLGLQAIAKAAKNSSTPPTAIIFTGDDVSKGNGEPGTDYFAMVQAPKISEEFNIPIYTIHTLHPIGEMLNSTNPDIQKSITALSPNYPAPSIDICVSNPYILTAIIIAAHSMCHG